MHPSWIVPGGVECAARRRRIATRSCRNCRRRCSDRAADAGVVQERRWTGSRRRSRISAQCPRCTRGWWTTAGELQWYDGRIRFKTPAGAGGGRASTPREYREFIGEASLRDSYLKAPYYKPSDIPTAIYRVGPLARLNVAEGFGTPEADMRTARVPPALRRDGAQLVPLSLRAPDRIAARAGED